ncbi:hypothetical protein [Caulobacter sp. S45]|uniref:hypothetical protein n=1 Tax=Caulobacter sp. S45 TaxID=1641861 RepID=UPI00131BE84A|nr:hypothetical protein [Caulobacter sp. S45]
MRFFSLIPFVAVLAAAASGAASAQTLDDDFRTLCVAPKGEMTRTTTLADAAGWKTLPADATPPTVPGGAKLNKYAIRLHSVGATTHLLVVGEGEPALAQGGPKRVRVCFIATPQFDAVSLASERALLKGAPVFLDAQSSVYLVDKTTDQVTALHGQASTAKMNAGGLAMVMLINTPRATAFAYQTPQPDK